jgi:hypothetical protein
MPTVPSPDDKQFAPTPEGNHIAVCYRVIDLGTSTANTWASRRSSARFSFRGKSRTRRWTTAAPSPSARSSHGPCRKWRISRKVLESWRGKAFAESDFGPGGFDIEHDRRRLHVERGSRHKNGKTYANIASVAKLPKGIAAPAPTNPRNLVWLSREDFMEGNLTTSRTASRR